MRRWIDERLQDLVLAVVAAAIGVASVFTTDPTIVYAYPPANGWLVLLALAATLPLAWRRVAPLAALAVSLAAVDTIMTLRWNEGVVPFATVVALYSVAAHRPVRVAFAGLAMTIGSFVLLGLVGAPFFDSAEGIFSALIFCLPFAIGLGVRRAAGLRLEAMERALEAEREITTAHERAAAAERLRIARELHDVVAHTLSVVIVQASVARHLLADDPARAEPALGAIEDASRRALDDLRRMLGVLRDGSEPTSELRPAADLAEFDELVALHRASGADTEATIDPAVATLPDSVRLTVLRIAQEALTNARRHAGGGAVKLRIECDADEVRVRIENEPGAWAERAGTGLGLVGMAERVGAFGGRLETGATERGGFRVLVTLPAGTPSLGRAGAP